MYRDNSNFDYMLDKDIPIVENLRQLKDLDRILSETVFKERRLGFSLSSRIINWEELYEHDIREGVGFKVDTSIIYGPETPELEALLKGDSIYSHKFGVKSSDPECIINMRYRCACGATKSPHLNIMCSECNTVTDSRKYIRGWVVLENDYKVFNSTYLHILIKSLMLKVKNPSKSGKSKSKSAEYGDFKNRLAYKDPITNFSYDMLSLTDPIILAEFINKYVVTDINKKFLIENIHLAYSTTIPVISKLFRHYSHSIGFEGIPTVEKNKINSHYENMCHNVKRINESPLAPKHKQKFELTSINKRLRDMHLEIYNTCFEDKESDLREKLYGKRIGYSGRLIVESTQFLSAADCTLSYAFFGTAMIDNDRCRKFLKKKGMRPKHEREIRLGNPGPESRVLLAKCLKMLEKKNLNYIITKRSPVIYKDSIQSLRVVALTHENVIRVSPFVLHNEHGDKDGDILFVCFADESIRLAVYIAFSPRMSTIDTRTMEYNPFYNLIDASYIIAYKMLDDDTNESNIFVDEAALST